MKASVFAVLIALLVCSFISGQSVDQQLKKLENDWAQAEVKKDFATLDRILADDYTFTDPDGKVFSKAQTIASFKSDQNVVTDEAVSELAVQVYGDAAVVTGLSKETLKGQTRGDVYRFTDTWVKRGGAWQCVAGHSSKVGKS
jgi:ketosteroid isomerase-like protein